MNATLDSLSRPPAASSPRRRFPAWLVPLALCAGFGLLFLALFRDRLLPAPAVRTGAVLATPAENAAAPAAGGTAPGAPLFQASGWIEPDPLPIKATALIDGVVETVPVLEGQQVRKGEPLATLIAVDAELAVAAAEHRHQTLISMRTVHLASIESAKKKLENVAAQCVAADTLEQEAEDRYRRVKDLKGAVSAADIVSSRLAHERARSGCEAARATAGEAEAELKRLELETETRDHEIAAAAVALDQARLALSRTRIPAPVDGRILRLAAAPGQKKMLLMDDPDSSTIAILYQPEHLQVRVDVPLADAAGLSAGQAANIRCSLLPDRVFHGTVTRITGEADVQRNTLQAKVRIDDPIDVLRPEMLCRVEFLGSAGSSSSPAAGSGSLATWAPHEALVDGAVWVCDPESKRVNRRAVRPSTETRDGHVRILEGLRPGEQLVLAPQGLREGQRVNPSSATARHD